MGGSRNASQRYCFYSLRKAIMGSVLDARLAGNAEAASANSSMATGRKCKHTWIKWTQFEQ
jgi:hypothetical protein